MLHCTIDSCRLGMIRVSTSIHETSLVYDAANVIKQSLHVNLLPFSAPKPECTTDPECPLNLACIQERCQDPCFTTVCGTNAECRVNNHRAVCICRTGYIGDPYTICEERKLQLIFFKMKFIIFSRALFHDCLFF
jgi:hypothetical protein